MDRNQPLNRGSGRWGLSVHYQSPPESPFVEVYMGDGIEAYLTPIASDRIGLAFLWDKARFSPESGGQILSNLLSSFPQLESRLSDARQIGQAQALGPLLQRRSQILSDGVALVGDAAGYIDAITGEGISLALECAEALTQVAANALKFQQRHKAGIITSSDLAPYAKDYKAITRNYRFLTKAALWLNRHPAMQEAWIRFLSKHPAIFQRVLSLNMGR